MALTLDIPDSDWSSQFITLGGVGYEVETTFNGRDDRWRLSIYTGGGEEIVSGITIIESQPLLYRYSLDNFSHGDLFVVRYRKDNLPVGRDNFGVGKSYELVYLSNDEIGEL